MCQDWYNFHWNFCRSKSIALCLKHKDKPIFIWPIWLRLLDMAIFNVADKRRITFAWDFWRYHIVDMPLLQSWQSFESLEKAWKIISICIFIVFEMENFAEKIWNIHILKRLIRFEQRHYDFPGHPVLTCRDCKCVYNFVNPEFATNASK